jgi:hypothetical protein
MPLVSMCTALKTTMIDPKFDRKQLLDVFDRELFEKQSNYFSTVPSNYILYYYYCSKPDYLFSRP